MDELMAVARGAYGHRGLRPVRRRLLQGRRTTSRGRIFASDQKVITAGEGGLVTK
jgi:hypothetical protein